MILQCEAHWPVWSRFADSYQPLCFDRSSMAKQYCSHAVNVFCDGSPSRMRRVRRISLGMTTLPRSSILRTIPVAFISPLLLVALISTWPIVCQKSGFIPERIDTLSEQRDTRFCGAWSCTWLRYPPWLPRGSLRRLPCHAHGYAPQNSCGPVREKKWVLTRPQGAGLLVQAKPENDVSSYFGP